ncbi:lytic transglycosylase domain-containing protein [Rheinheimera sp. F8]|uniref:lytic transglycosylase domain-containing protein n=1 Tax=Rheinheimera sp. F8 TaxID=1763998 RepID=UPI001AD7F4F0|nr:lytic transglycosylase domain-containing protein [Rheinheimera sp. F8]
MQQQQPWFEQNAAHLTTQSCHLVWLAAELRAADLPEEYAYVPFVESSFDPFAVSKSGAAGMWQIMPITAKSLQITPAQRFDPIEATRAAAKLIKQHQAVFGDDALMVLSAYNAGEGSVVRRLQENYQARRTFVGLHSALPAETQHYAPRFLLANLNAGSISRGPIAVVERRTSMTAIASSLALSPTQLQKVNPALGTDLKAGQCLFLPMNDSRDYTAARGPVAVFTPEQGWLRRPVLQADSGQIARNSLVQNITSKSHAASKNAAAYQTVRLPAGASWSWLADVTGVPIKQLRRKNPKNHMRAGEAILLPVRERVIVAKRGDTLSTLAQHHQTDVRTLTLLNQLQKTQMVKAGQKLRIWN